MRHKFRSLVVDTVFFGSLFRAIFNPKWWRQVYTFSHKGVDNVLRFGPVWLLALRHRFSLCCLTLWLKVCVHDNAGSSTQLPTLITCWTFNETSLAVTLLRQLICNVKVDKVQFGLICVIYEAGIQVRCVKRQVRRLLACARYLYVEKRRNIAPNIEIKESCVQTKYTIVRLQPLFEWIDRLQLVRFQLLSL